MPPEPLTIGQRNVGPGAPVWIVAEAGVNHNGDLAQAERLVLEAKAAGADCVKFQTFKAERVASTTAPKAQYQLRNTAGDESQLDMLRRLELDDAMHEALMRICEHEGIEFLSAPYSLEDVDYLDRLGVRAYKVASALLVEPDFVARVAATGKPVLLSTGLATLAEVREAVGVARAAGDGGIVVLQCTTNYPAPAAEANVRAMQTMAREFDVLAGYSDHTVGSAAAVAAVALGAVVVEKHLTLDKTLPGPDQSTSADPAEFRRFVAMIREAEAALGDGRKEPAPSELPNLRDMRRSLVAARDIASGSVLTDEMLVAKRPASGIAVRERPSVVGRTTKVDIERDRPLEWWMLA